MPLVIPPPLPVCCPPSCKSHPGGGTGRGWGTPPGPLGMGGTARCGAVPPAPRAALSRSARHDRGIKPLNVRNRRPVLPRNIPVLPFPKRAARVDSEFLGTPPNTPPLSDSRRRLRASRSIAPVGPCLRPDASLGAVLGYWQRRLRWEGAGNQRRLDRLRR